jgi:hypothetical protein
VNTVRRDLAHLGRLAAFIAGGIALGVLFSLVGVDDIENHPAYFYVISALLAVGLYGSTSGIPRVARRDLPTILLVVTVGVVLKAALVGVALWLLFDDPLFFLLAVAVAQIDPLSVASFMQDSRMSERARAVLGSWASFDDPVTVLLTVSLATWVGPWLQGDQGRLESAMGGMAGIAGFFVNTGYNAGLVAVAVGVWWLVRRRAVAAVLSVAAVAAVAVWQFLMLGLATAGLFMRPPLRTWPQRVEAAVRWAFYGAAVALGIVLAGGVDVGRGVALGVAAFMAQVVVGSILTAKLPAHDRVHLAVSQQNGITSIVLALLLEPSLPGVVAIIGPAIITINLMHAAANWAVDRMPFVFGIDMQRARGAEPTPAEQPEQHEQHEPTPPAQDLHSSLSTQHIQPAQPADVPNDDTATQPLTPAQTLRRWVRSSSTRRFGTPPRKPPD